MDISEGAPKSLLTEDQLEKIAVACLNIDNASRSKNIPTIYESMGELTTITDTKQLRELPEVLETLEPLKQDEELFNAFNSHLIDQIEAGLKTDSREKVARDVNIAELTGSTDRDSVFNLIEVIKTEYLNPQEEAQKIESAPEPTAPLSIEDSNSAKGFHRRISRRGVIKTAVLGGLGIAGSGVTAMAVPDTRRLMSNLVPKVTYDSDKIRQPLKATKSSIDSSIAVTTIVSENSNQPTPLPTEIPSQPATTQIEIAHQSAIATPTAEPASETPTPQPPNPIETTVTPKATPTPDIAAKAKQEVGQVNLSEYFLGELVEVFKNWRLDRVKNEPAFRERMEGLTTNEAEKKHNLELAINSDVINMVYLGIDNTRERPDEFTDQGWGRSDVIMLVSFDPHTLKMGSISFPRDLFAPELTRFKFKGGARINSATMAPYIDKNANSYDLMRQIMETATGVPIDGIIKTDIDFMQGYQGKLGSFPGIFDQLFPGGLNIQVDEDIVDKEYPTDNYGTKILEIKKGSYVMNARQVTEYARSRHSDSDFGRSERQRKVLIASARKLVPNVLQDFIAGDPKSLDTIIEALNQQVGNANIEADFNLIEVLKKMKGGLVKLRTPQGLAALAAMGANSADLLKDPSDKFISYGLTRNNVISNVSSNEPYHELYMLKVADSSTGSRATNLGNFMSYWAPLRSRVRSEVLSKIYS